MSNEAVTPEEVARHVHPKDRRVILTQRMDIFIAAARNHDEHRAVILERDAKFKTKLTAKFQAVANMLKPEFIILDADVDKQEVKIHRDGTDEFQTLSEVKSELAFMIALYNSLSGFSKLSMTLSRALLTQTMHTHEMPVLNCNWLTNGTAWENEGKAPLHVETGDLLFIKPGFQHTASFERGIEPQPSRMLLALYPRY